MNSTKKYYADSKMQSDMKAEELMIGDWVIRKSDKRPMTVVELRYAETIAAITPDDVYYGDMQDYHESEVEPISLTREILEKNGFKKGEDDQLGTIFHLQIPTGFERDSYTIKISIYKKPICDVSTLFKCWGWIPPSNGGVNDIHLCNLLYVHQIQHALRLCGIEKDLVI